MPVPCARCDSPLPVWELPAGQGAVCTSCGSRNLASLFPALFATPAVPVAEAALGGEAACFDHPAKRAVAACHRCGRFVCALCSVEFGGIFWCPSCVAAGKGEAVNLDASRVLYDSITLVTPFLALLIWPITLLGAPGSLVLAFTQWKRPLSMVRRSRWRFVVGALVGLLEIACWIWLAIYLWQRVRMGQ